MPIRPVLVGVHVCVCVCRGGGGGGGGELTFFVCCLAIMTSYAGNAFSLLGIKDKIDIIYSQL